MPGRMASIWLAAGLAAACAVSHAADDARGALDASRARWQAAALSDYEYGYHKYCDCYRDTPPETVVTVADGKVARVRHRPAGFSGEVPAEDRNVQYYWTVEELFELLETALTSGATVRAEYDAALGFPTLVYVDYDVGLIGDELDLRLTRVAPLSP